MFHEWPTATTDMAVLPDILRHSFAWLPSYCARDRQDKLTLRRTGGAGLRAGLNSLEAGTEARPTGSNTLRLPCGKPIAECDRIQALF